MSKYSCSEIELKKKYVISMPEVVQRGGIRAKDEDNAATLVNKLSTSEKFKKWN